MAELTDEEKAAKLVEAVEVPQEPGEPKNQPEEPTNQEDTPAEEPKEDEEKPQEPEVNPATFTKQFQNLKGESWEEYGKSLEDAYQNSWNEALKLRKQLDDNNRVVDEARKLLANQDGNQPAAVPPSFDINSLPEIQMLRAEQQTKMIDAFNSFADRYPQARDQQGFDQFEKASKGSSQAFSDAFGRLPTYPELFEKTAQLLGWQSSDKNAKKDAAIKDAGASGDTQAGSVPPPKKTTVSEQQLVIGRRLWPDKTDSDLVKELSQYQS